MSFDIVALRLEEYNPLSKQEELNALKEIYQEIALGALSRSGFFKVAAFQGGTCLRILFNLERFSEDLDFVLLEKTSDFIWDKYLKPIEIEFNSFGIDLDVLSRSKADAAVQRAFIKQNSFGKLLQLKNKFSDSDKQLIKIKLEIDTNPSRASNYQTHFLDYPYPFSVLTQDFPSLFASKCHALLCREFVKGRDWFDYLWYIQRKVEINLNHLKSALFQFGPYKDKSININSNWVIEKLTSKIEEIDWNEALQDVMTFLNSENRKLVSSWSTELFLAMTEKLKKYWTNT